MKIADLVELPDPERVQALRLRLIPLAQGARFERLPPAAQDFFLINLWLGEVGNGGHRQFYEGSAGDRAQETLEALLRVGATSDTIDVLSRSFAPFEGRPPRERAERCEVLAGLGPEAVERAFEPLDRALPDLSPRLIATLASQVVAHRQELAFIDRHPSGLKALDFPPDLTLADVLDKAPGERCWDIAERLAAQVEEDGLPNLAPAARTWFLAWVGLGALLRAHLRGLLEQGTRHPLPAVVEAIERVGPPAVAEVVRRITAHAKDGRLPRTELEAKVALETWDPRADAELQSLQTALQGLSAQLLGGLCEFASAHRGAIPEPPHDPFLVVTAAAHILRGRPSRPLAGPAGTFLDALEAVDEVSAGGFLGWFFSGAADRHAEALDALETLGAGGACSLLRQAAALLPDGPARATAARRAQLAALPEPARQALAALRPRWQEVRSGTIAVLAAFVLVHRDEL